MSKTAWNAYLQARLNTARSQHLYRVPRVLDSPQGPVVRLHGRTLLAFCSNDYLGLANDTRVAETLAQGARKWGAGSGASHLLSGHGRAHAALEEELAAFTGRERALLFSSGYMANLAVMASLLGRGDTLIQDRLNHASLIDGAQLARARLLRFSHADCKQAKQRLQQARGRILLATDGVFSMDGDLAPLPELAALCQAYGAWLMVDDAHGFGVLGDGGKGSLEHWGLTPSQVPILMGTLGKALGTAGAFVAGSRLLIETLIQDARSYIFTTALPAALAEATRTSLRLLQEEPWRREHVRRLIAFFRREAQGLGLPLLDSQTPIQGILAGSAERALAWSQALEHRGIWIPAIRPPTVPRGQARLRISFSARHELEHVERLLVALSRL